MRIDVSLEFFDAERRDFELVLDAIRRIHSASRAQLEDLDWLHDVVCSVGLAVLHPPEEIYADKAELMNGSHQGLTQYPLEFARWLRLLAPFRVRSYLEIGCYNGGTACLAAAYLHRFNPDFRASTVDLTPWFIFHSLVRDLIPLEYHVRRTSYDFRDRAFDAVFIDGDHGFPWAWADYENVGRAARVAGLHDVNGRFFHDNEALGGVTAVWEIIKRDESGPGIRFEELFDHPADYFGIGVRIQEPTA